MLANTYRFVISLDFIKLRDRTARLGVKFVITATPGTNDLTELLHGIYEIYADYVLKVLFIFFLYSCDLLFLLSSLSS